MDRSAGGDIRRGFIGPRNKLWKLGVGFLVVVNHCWVCLYHGDQLQAILCKKTAGTKLDNQKGIPDFYANDLTQSWPRLTICLNLILDQGGLVTLISYHLPEFNHVLCLLNLPTTLNHVKSRKLAHSHTHLKLLNALPLPCRMIELIPA